MGRPKANLHSNIAGDFMGGWYMQLGVEQHGQVYAECPYEDCDGGMLDFWWWDNYKQNRAGTDTLPEVPLPDSVYPS